MRIVIDMQGAQTESRFRGIGRYTLSFTRAIVCNRGEHEVLLALNGLFRDTIEPIRAAFDGLLPQENIRVWYAPGPMFEMEPGNDARREVAELIREAFLANLKPDVVHMCSLFEGYVDDAVTSIGRFDKTTPVSVTLHDLIPLLNPDYYLKPNPRYAQYYQRKVEYLKQGAIYLAISESSRQEALTHLDAPTNRIFNTSAAVDSRFQSLPIANDVAAQVCRKFGLTRPFVLYTGGADERKNLPRLIQAFASLPTALRKNHQMLLAGKMPEGNITELKQQARTAGLKADELCFTGYVTDEELVQLYNLCKLFVFPSWHEGFGLPALEAMACGAPVIGANTSSLPEVIGLDTALFDPLDVNAITTKLVMVLEDDEFRTMLREHGVQQTKKFSWDASARWAIAAWESLHASHQSTSTYINRSLSGSRLIHGLVQHIPPSEVMGLTTIAFCLAQNRSMGIERQLMVDVSELAQRDAATGVQRAVRSYLRALLQSPPAGFRVEPVYATREEGYRYARRFTQHFLGQTTENLADEPVQWQRGDIFFGLDMQHHVQLSHIGFYRQLRRDGVTVKFLVHDLLPIQLADMFKDANAKELHEHWLTMIATTDGAICVSKATADAFGDWISKNAVRRASNFQTTWVHNGGDINASHPSQGLPLDAHTILNAIASRPSFICVATLEPRKGQQQVVNACELLWNEGINVNLVLIGQQGWKVENLAEKIRKHQEQGRRLFWLEGISDEYLERVYSASTCLIAASINEGFGLPLIEAAHHGIPIVARDIPIFREVAGDCAFYFKGETPHDLAAALNKWLGLYESRRHPKSDQLRWSTWQESAEKLKIAITQENYPRRQLLVDVSELVQRDAKSGIQRVVRSVLKEWLNSPPEGYRVEPVYATVRQGYRYARCFIQDFIGDSNDALQDEPIEYSSGDVFFGLDFQPQVVAAHRAFYRALRTQGVGVRFLVHDLLCIRFPEHFLPGSAEGFSQWLKVIAESDGAVCVSKTVAEELAEWVKENGPVRQRPFRINWSHNGVDIVNSVPTIGLTANEDAILDHLRSRISFLMVGTVEPRKGHAQVLQAFEALWQSAVDVNLVIVGKQGWMVESLIDCFRAHPELNKRLFWLEGISDEYLEKVYAAANCLIAASFGEGFGLPLIEAAQHKLPIIARDIPVFREIAGNHVYYFTAVNGVDLAKAIRDWLALNARKQVPLSEGMPFLTWKESAERLMRLSIGEQFRSL